MTSHHLNRTRGRQHRITSVGAFVLVCAILAVQPVAHALAQAVHLSMGDGQIVATGFPAVDPSHPDRVIVTHVEDDYEDRCTLFELQSVDAGGTVARPWRVIVASADEVLGWATPVRPATRRRWDRRIRDANRALRTFVPLRAFAAEEVEVGDDYIQRAIVPTVAGPVSVEGDYSHFSAHLAGAPPFFTGPNPVQTDPTATEELDCSVPTLVATVYVVGSRLLAQFQPESIPEFCLGFPDDWRWINLPGAAASAASAPPAAPQAFPSGASGRALTTSLPTAGVASGIAWTATNARGMPAVGLWFRTHDDAPICGRVLQVGGRPSRHRLRFSAVDRCFATEAEASRFLASALASRSRVEPRVLAHYEGADRGRRGSVPLGGSLEGRFSYDASAATLEMTGAVLDGGHARATHGQAPIPRHRQVTVDVMNFDVEGVAIVLGVLQARDARGESTVAAAVGFGATR